MVRFSVAMPRVRQSSPNTKLPNPGPVQELWPLLDIFEIIISTCTLDLTRLLRNNPINRKERGEKMGRDD